MLHSAIKKLASLVVLVGAMAAPATAQPFIGDEVPALGDMVGWHLGPAAPDFEPGVVYVLDFWATWCPPCYPMIPRLSELQRQHGPRELVIIGIAMGTDVGTPLPRFLAQEAGRIEYTIAEPVNEDRLESALLHPSLHPTEGLWPYLMIIDRQGRLAWASDPGDPERGFEQALEDVLAGRFDRAAAVRRAQEHLVADRGGDDVRRRLAELAAAERWGDAATLALEHATTSPAVFGADAVDLFELMLCRGAEDDAYRFGSLLVGGPLKGQILELVRVARAILLAPDLDHRDLELAESAVQQAMASKSTTDPDLVYELAKIGLGKGDKEGARALQSRAVELALAEGRDASYVSVIRDLPIETILHSQRRQWNGCADHRAEEQGAERISSWRSEAR